jgi:phosphoglycolate phosphatase-like HAD superfamily hydrolase
MGAGLSREGPADPKLLVFDFDGTLADTLSACLAVSNRLAAEFDYRRVDPEELEGLRGLSWQELRQFLGVPLVKVPLILARGRRLILEDGCAVRPFPGLAEVLRDLRERGHRLGVVTSASSENVAAFLGVHGLDLFDFVSASSSLWGKAKRLNDVLRREGLAPRDVLYIGDETRDIEAAKKASIRSVAVTWGFNLRPALERFAPDFIAQEPRDLLRVVEWAGNLG